MVKRNFYSVNCPDSMLDKVLGHRHRDISSFKAAHPNNSPVSYMLTLKSIETGVSAFGVFLGKDYVDGVLESIMDDLPKDKGALQDVCPNIEPKPFELMLRVF